MNPLFVEAGHRVLAPELMGFRRPDKPTERKDYTGSLRREWQVRNASGIVA